MKPLLALVGRPNVGKSTLFNRLVGRRLALVEDLPGVTRDRHYADISWAGRDLSIVDTGGFVPGGSDDVLEGVRAQAEIAVETSDLVLFLVDGRAGLVTADTEIAAILRKSGKPVLVVVNKLDHAPTAEAGAAEFYQLGFPEVFPVSAEHALGIDALLDAGVAQLPPVAEGAAPGIPDLGDSIRVAIIGRPNVGKSTLLNALVGQERQLAGPLPGTTRDPIDTELVHAGSAIVLTDTAGIRKKRALAERVERVSILGALRSVDRSDVAVLVLDATEPGVEQDARLAGIVEQKGRALVVFVNKWDLVSRDERKQDKFREALKWQLRFVPYAPILFGSALQGGRQVSKVLDIAVQLFEQFRFRARTPMLNRLMQKAVDAHAAPSDGGRPLRFYYITQVASSPPTFAITCNRPRSVTKAYRRYLTNQLREALGLRVPLHLVFRERPGHSSAPQRKRPSG